MDQTLFSFPFFGHLLEISGWKIVGYVGLTLFTGRWFVQMIASRKMKRSTLPIAFWYMSLCGSALLLAYFIFGKNDSVGILSNLFPATVAAYNLMLELSHRKQTLAKAQPSPAPEPHSTTAAAS